MRSNMTHECLFHYGVQITPDGDLLPNTLMIFPRDMPKELMTDLMLDEATENMAELGMEKGEGVFQFGRVKSWTEFAELELSDQVKLTALAQCMLDAHGAIAAVASRTVDAAVLALWEPESE